MMVNEQADTRREPTPEEQAEFDALWQNVLLACKTVVFNTPAGNAEWLRIMGGQENVNRYYEMRKTLNVELK